MVGWARLFQNHWIGRASKEVPEVQLYSLTLSSEVLVLMYTNHPQMNHQSTSMQSMTPIQSCASYQYLQSSAGLSPLSTVLAASTPSLAASTRSPSAPSARSPASSMAPSAMAAPSSAASLAASIALSAASPKPSPYAIADIARRERIVVFLILIPLTVFIILSQYQPLT